MNIFSYIKTKIDILDVISEYTQLKQAGNYWKGHCPFHNEKTGSFTVSPHKGIFYCFGCHVGGDVITFISKLENYSQFEAAKHLADTYQIELPTELVKNIQVQTAAKDNYFSLCGHIADWCHEQLLKTPAVIRYLQHRGFNKQSVNLFKIGYFPGGPRATQTLVAQMKKHAIMLTDLLEAKIVAQGKTNIYSPFEERIIFPIKDIIGRHCGFGGRIFRDADQRVKYYNSHENPYFSKGSLLFGFDLAKKNLQKNDYMFIVEGYTDCIAMSQYGFGNTVATLGTACTKEHLKTLSRYVNYLYVLYDGDKAGKNAILRLTELCWQVNIELKVISMPEHEDPASFLQKGGDLQALIHQATDIFAFFVDTIGQQFLSKTLGEKVKLAKDIIQTIECIQDPIKKDILLQKASKIMQIPIESIKSTDQTNQPPPTPLNKSQHADQRLEKKIFFAIINNIELLQEDNGDFLAEYLPQPIKDIFIKLKVAKNKGQEIDFVSFFDTLNENDRKYVSRLLLEFEGNIEKSAFEKLLLQFQKKHWKYIVKKIKEKLEIAKKEANDEKVALILQTFCQLKKKILGNGI